MGSKQRSFSTIGLRRLLSLVAVAIAAAACVEQKPPLPGAGDDAGRIVVYRDTWGVPHIYAPSIEEGLYAQGWAQAEDRPEQLLLNYLMAMGEHASVIGQEGVEGDVQARLFDHHGHAKRAWASVDAELRAQVSAFVDGVNAYYRAHPEDVPEWWRSREVDGSMVIAFQRFFLDWWTIHEAYTELRRGGVEPGAAPDLRGSNQFAVAPSRSAEGAAILAIDPHLRFDAQYRFWEFRVHAGPWQGSGVGLPGMPFILLGHTRHLAWAMTTGGPDTSDVYELVLSPEPDPGTGALRYLYEGDWRELTLRRVIIQVKGGEPVERTFWFSHHGPVIARHGDRAWAAKTAYQSATTVVPAFRQLNLAEDYTGAVHALGTLELFPQNVMVADTSGNIYYQRTGRVPRRPKGFDWSKPVDGSTGATEWQGLHPASELLQVLNPPQGYMQNCNVPPGAMMPGSPFRLESTAAYIFSSCAWGPSLHGWVNQRAARAIELLSEDELVTAEEAIAYVTDVKVFGAERWIAALEHADEAVGDEYAAGEHYRAGLDDLLSWDLQNTRESTGALKYQTWRAQLVDDHGDDEARVLTSAIDDNYAIVEQRTPRPLDLSVEQLRMLAGSFANAMNAIVEHHGSIDATFGDHHRVGRGGESWPIGGSGKAPGAITLRALWYGEREVREGHTTWAAGGQTSTQVVVMSDPPESWIYAPLGQSDREGSSHFDDQAEMLFSPRRLRSSWWLPEDLASHTEVRTVLVR